MLPISEVSNFFPGNYEKDKEKINHTFEFWTMRDNIIYKEISFTDFCTFIQIILNNKSIKMTRAVFFSC